MAQKLYSSFKHFTFGNKTCFLSGNEAEEKLFVFPEWLLEKYELREKPIKLLDEHIVNYGTINVPCSKGVARAAEQLDDEMEAIFEKGFDEVRNLPEINLFQWIAKWVYGMIHFEILEAVRQQSRTGETPNFSQSLIHKFENLQYMLQSLILPVEFEGVKPWTICVFKVENPPDTFSYRDEINTLTFSLRMQDFGIIACLQDNSSNRKYHQQLIGKIGEAALHPVQFEEVCARFFYSSYLFNRLPEYTILPTPEAVYIEAMPFFSTTGKPTFDPWQNKTYAQVLENFWKPWGILLFEIIKNPEDPLSFLYERGGDLRTSARAEEEVVKYAIN